MNLYEFLFIFGDASMNTVIEMPALSIFNEVQSILNEV